MNILTIDTATSMELVVLSSKNSVSDKSGKVSVSHSTTLFNNIDSAFTDLKLNIKDIDIIGVGIGPGSFTGIRIAVTTARMLSQLIKKPLIGIKTHLFFASSITEKMKPGENILIAFDAKKGRVFGALYAYEKDNVVQNEIVTPGDYNIDFIIDKVNINHGTVMIGDGCKKYHEALTKRIPEHRLITDFRLSGEKVCELVAEKFRENSDNNFHYSKALPFYSRKSDAEIIRELNSRNSMKL